MRRGDPERAADHPERAVRRRAGGGRGGQRRPVGVGRARPLRVRAAPALGHRREAGRPGPGRGRPHLGVGLSGPAWPGREAAAWPDRLLPRRAHDRARLHGAACAVSRDPAGDGRHGAAAEVRGRVVPDRARRPVADPDRRGAGHESASRRDADARRPACSNNKAKELGIGGEVLCYIW